MIGDPRENAVQASACSPGVEIVPRLASHPFGAESFQELYLRDGEEE
jgi:hypothetical protein